ncbi:MAG: porin [Halieaceae bacterium]|jgi:predicted porin|nr:porin [Halieaceae bacterium]
MKKFVLCKRILPAAIGAAMSLPAMAAVEVYNEDGTTLSFDASFNAFFSSTSTETEVDNVQTASRDQARVRSGFLPNWFGANFTKDVGNFKLGGRASFWVSINDNDETPTDGLIDTRQFYGTVDSSWGQILVGKDFTLYNRSNIFGDEILLGYGMTNDTLGLVDSGYVSFGNIGSGYIYPMPTSQITYRSPDVGGFKLSVGLMDPSRTATDANGNVDAAAEESSPRLEGELTFNTAFSDVSNLNLWLGFLSQTSEGAAEEIESQGVSYGVKYKVGGLSLHASGYDGEGVGFLVGTADNKGLGLNALNVIQENGDEVDSTGYLLQGAYTFGDTRAVLSYGNSQIDNSDQWENETTTAALFHSFHPNLIGVLEYTMNEISYGGGAVSAAMIEEEADAIAIGLIVNF